MECVSPARNKWRIRWDVQLRDDGSASYMEEEFTHKPSEEEVRQTIVSWFTPAPRRISYPDSNGMV